MVEGRPCLGSPDSQEALLCGRGSSRMYAATLAWALQRVVERGGDRFVGEQHAAWSRGSGGVSSTCSPRAWGVRARTPVGWLLEGLGVGFSDWAWHSSCRGADTCDIDEVAKYEGRIVSLRAARVGDRTPGRAGEGPVIHRVDMPAVGIVAFGFP